MIAAARLSSLALAGLAASAQGAVTVTFQQVGADVVATTTGSFDSFEGLASPATTMIGGGAEVYPVGPQVKMSASGSAWNSVFYSGNNLWITSPANIGTGSSFVTANSVSGNTSFRVIDSGVYVADNYVLGTQISNTATWINRTFANLGLREGLYIWAWEGDSFTVVIGNAVPEPSTYGLILGGLALAGAAVRRRRQRA